MKSSGCWILIDIVLGFFNQITNAVQHIVIVIDNNINQSIEQIISLFFSDLTLIEPNPFTKSVKQITFFFLERYQKIPAQYKAYLFIVNIGAGQVNPVKHLQGKEKVVVKLFGLWTLVSQ